VHRNLEAIFTGVTTAGDEQRSALPFKRLARHKNQFFNTRYQLRQSIARLWALQRQQGLLGQGNDLATRANVLLNVRDVSRFARTIDHHKNIVTAVDKHQVVQDAALLVQQQTVALFAHRQTHHIDRHEALKRCSCIGPDQTQLAHVRHIKQAGGVARVFVFGHQAQRVLHRHAVASERHHARAQGDVQIVEWCFEKFGVRQKGLHAKHHLHLADEKEPCCPLYLRDSTHRRMTMRLAPSVDARLQRTSLQQNHVYQSWLPERSAFGGVAQPKGWQHSLLTPKNSNPSYMPL